MRHFACCCWGNLLMGRQLKWQHPDEAVDSVRRFKALERRCQSH